MEQILYSIEQVAERLGLHVKTVRHYVREGRLKAVRIGKQYRVKAADLQALTGQIDVAPEVPPVSRTRQVEVSSVVEIQAISPELSDRVTNLLLGAANSRGYQEDPLHVQAIYDAPRGRLKVILIGGLELTASLLRVVKTLVEEQ